MTGLSEDIYVYGSHLFHLLCDMGFAAGMSNVVVGCGHVTIVADFNSWEIRYIHINRMCGIICDLTLAYCTQQFLLLCKINGRSGCKSKIHCWKEINITVFRCNKWLPMLPRLVDTTASLWTHHLTS